MTSAHDPLLSACKEGNLLAVTAQISHHQRLDPSYTPPFKDMLNAATLGDHVNVTKFVLDQHNPIDAEIMQTVLIGRAVSVYEFFLRNEAVDVNFYIPWFGDILSNVARDDDFEMTRLCLSHGADPNRNLVDEHMSILAAVAGSERGSVQIAKLLVDHGAVVKGSGAIIMAAEEGRMEMVGFLLAVGADIDEVGIEHPTDPRFKEDMGTALHRAAFGGYVEIVEFLIAKGADREVRDPMGRRALDLAREKGDGDTMALLK
ncbi:MAG: hypothetical protein Q9216_006366 [Gyalolechia sp. 2 TL-2023]